FFHTLNQNFGLPPKYNNQRCLGALEHHYASTPSRATFAGIDFGTFGKTRTGWTAGGGVEWMFAPGWSAFLEGNYMDFGDQNHTVFGTAVSGVCLAPVGCSFDTHVKAATVLVGVNWRWGGKAP